MATQRRLQDFETLISCRLLMPDLDDSAQLYLDLLKRFLTRYRFPEPYRPIQPYYATKRYPLAAFQKVVSKWNLELVERVQVFDDERQNGSDWPPNAETMIGLKRLDNLQHCIEDVIRQDIPGDLVETGVWRGGAVIFMRGVLKAYGETGRRVWAADSFAGLPTPNEDDYPADAGSVLYRHASLAVSLEDVRANFERYGLLDEQVRFLKGWFRDTLSSAPIERIGVLRLDGDLYESTMDALNALYPKLSSNGYAIIDDYYSNLTCTHAVDDYREAHDISDTLVPIDGDAAYWRKTATHARQASGAQQ